MSTTLGIQAGVTTGSSLSGGSGSLPSVSAGTLDLYGDEIFGGYSTRRLKGIFPKLLPADYSGARAAYSLRKVRSGYPKSLPANYGDGAAAAYSLRRVNAAYNGPAIKVRRSSDDAVQDIGLTQVGGLDTTALTTFVNTEYTLADEDFSSAIGWSLGTGVSITDGVLRANTSGIASAYKGFGDKGAQQVRVTFTVSNYVSGTVRYMNFGTATLGTARSADGTYTETLTLNAGGNLNHGLQFNSFVGDIDDFEIVQLTADGHVTTWFDQSGNGNNATNATASEQPLVVSGGTLVTENGKAAIQFDGSDMLVASGFSGSSIQDSYFVMNYQDDSNAMWMHDLYTNNPNRYAPYVRDGESSSPTQGYGTPSYYVNGSAVTITTRTEAYNEFSNSKGQILRVDEGANTSTWQDISFGLWYTSYGYNGNVQEIIIFNSDQSDNRPFIEENINVYYDIYAQDEWDKESAIKVRRSSDDALQDIGFVGNELDTSSLLAFVNEDVEKIVNGDFATDTDWTKGTGWTISGGTANCDGTQTSSSEFKTAVGIDIQGREVTFSFEVKNYSAGTLTATVEGTGALEFSGINANGVYSTTATSSDALPRVVFTASSDFVGSIDDVSVIQTTADGHVTTWYDQSGFGNHASNLTATQQPLIVDAGNVVTKNGKAAIDFDGVDDNFTFSDTGTMSNGCSSFTVLAADDAAQDAVVFYKVVDSDNTLSVGLRSNVVGARFRLGGAETNKGGTSSTDQVLLSQTSTTSPFMTAHLDGVEVTSAANIRLSGVGSSIGSRRGVDYHFDGTMQEIVFFESNQSTNRRDIAWNINDHYSIYEQWNRNSALSVRRSSDDTTKQIGFDGSSDMSESEVLSFVNDASPVLDDNSGAVSAYSLRKVLTAYTGSAIKVRRSSDDALQDIGFDSNGDLDTTALLAFVGNNLCSNPNEWANGATRNGWTEISGSVFTFVENVTDPDGGTNATRITRTATGSGSFRNNFDASIVAGEQYTFSVYLRSTNSAQVVLDIADQTSSAITLDSTWTLYTHTITADSTPLGFADFVIASPTDGVVEVYNPMVNHGATALPFEDNASAGAGFGYVTTWFDQTGNSDATQTTDSEQPLVVSAGAVVTEGNRPAMSLVDGQYFDNAGVDGYSRFDFFSVSKITDTLGMFLTFTTGGGKYSWVYQQDSTNTSFRSGFGTPTMYSNGVLQSISDRGDVYNAYNGHKIITTLGADTSTWEDGKFFAYPSGFGVTGTVQEIISFDSDQSSSRLGIEGNIGRYYNITGYRNGFVSKWYDQSNNDNHLENATASQQPKIVEDGVMITENGKPAIEFNRTTEEDILSAAASFSQPVTHFFVRRITDLTNGTQVPLSYQSTVGTPWGEIYYQNLFRTHFSGGYLGTFEGVEDLLLQYVFANGTNSTIAYNGAEGDTGNTGTNSVYAIHIGRNSSSGTYESNVKAQELIVYQRDASAIRREIEEIINRHFRIYL